MKKISNFLITLFLITGCAGGSKQSTGELVVIDVTQSYPKKELKLQDIVDIEYIPLETTDEFLCPGNLDATVSDNFIAIWDMQRQSIILFDRTGKGLKNLNYRGQGPGEYQMVSDIAFDEDNNEMFVVDFFKTQIFVYDLQGKFIRTFRFQDEYNAQFIRNFDRESLICTRFPRGSRPPFFIISKQDGAFKEIIDIPNIKQVSLSVQLNTGDRVMDFMGSPSVGPNFKYIPYRNNWILVDLSSDTIFTYSSDFKMTPFLIRTPSIHAMNPEVFLIPYLFTDRYYFMESVKKASYDAETRQFPTTYLMYDCMEKAVFEYTIENDDYPDKPFTPSKGRTVNSSDSEIVSFVKFEAFELVEANREGKLKGRLKEVASKLDEDDNPVLMLLKHKKL